ncbi:MAG: hypothetical protein QOG02_1085 [Gaiellales bacterium]|nr:hypothetical protein [Gaiellales bacterium]
MIERVRGLCFADALSLAGLGLCAAGAVVTGDGLVAAAQRSPSAASMNWHDRLLLGLWTFRLEHALWFTLGLVVLWVGLGLGGRIGAHTEQVARLVGGVAIGYLLLAAAVLAGSTIVAASGSVGSGVEASFTGRERVATWLLQVATAAAMATVWALAGGRLGERFAIAADAAAPSAAEADDQETYLDDEHEPEPLGTPLPAPVAPPAVHPDAVAALEARALGQIPAAAEPATPAVRARRLFEERLSFSPRRDDARKLVDQVLAAERAGRLDEAASLADRLAAM